MSLPIHYSTTQATTPIQSLPGFIGLGVQKGGTTTLHQLLSQHPQLLMPTRKELHYFSLNHHLGPAWYQQQWPAAPAARLRGEITPYYIFHPQAPQRLRALLPQARLLILLRDPVERALSQYFHSRRLGLEPLELEPALDAEPQRLAGADARLAGSLGRHPSHQEHSYLSRSRYEQQIPRWQRLFPAEHLLILRSEDLFTQPSAVWERLQAFLGLQLVPFPAHAFGRIHAGGGEAATVAAGTRQRLREQLAPTYSYLAELCA